MSTSELAPGRDLAGSAALIAPVGVPDGSDAPDAALVGAAPDSARALGSIIERLANQYLSGTPGPTLELGRQNMPGALAAPGAPAPGPLAPPTGLLPAAASLGAGGFSPGAGWTPPTPGGLQTPPLASGPLPKESDLRTLPAMLSEGLGVSSPVGLARDVAPDVDGAPYFLEHVSDAPRINGSAARSLPVVTGAPAPGPTAPPAGGPSPASRGAGGASPGAGWVPPTPGLAQQVPSASQPSLEEADLHTAAASFSERSGFSSPLGLAQTSDSSRDTEPYFMQIAGLPAAALSSDAALGAPHPTPAIVPMHGGAPGARVTPTTWPAAASGGASAPSAPGHSVPGYAQSTLAPGPTRAHSPAEVSGSTARVTDQQELPVDAALTARPGHSPLLPRGGASRTGSSPQLDTFAGGAIPGGGSYSPSEVSLLPFAFESHGASQRTAARGERRPFDPVSVRNDFPILKERVHGREVIWFDNAATTQKPRVVIDRISYFYEHENSNIHRAAHTLAARATDAYEGARETVRRFINAPSKGEIIFARGTTEAINLVAQSWGRRYLQPGDEVLITWLEHHANIVPWQLICSERGARLRVAPVDDDGQVLLYEYEKLLNSHTKFVSLSHVSNALGTITPAAEMVAMAHRHGAKVLVDGAQAVSHMPVDVQTLDCDFYVFSGHKIFGPTGIGALFGKASVLDDMPPYQGGGNMIRDVTFEKTQFQEPPARFEAGTPNIADAVGLGAALDYVSTLGIENISRYEHELLVYATERLLSLPGLRLFGTAPDKAGVLSFTLEGLRTEDIGVALDREGIAVRAGHHCAQPILRRFGQETTVRASLAPYNTRDDVDALAAALERLRAMRY
jgi:cysteine desulfurase / selenocysteine lyase